MASLSRGGAITKPIKQVNLVKMIFDGPSVFKRIAHGITSYSCCAHQNLCMSFSPLQSLPASSFLALSQSTTSIVFEKQPKTHPETVTPAMPTT
jgi:hypothetical protein